MTVVQYTRPPANRKTYTPYIGQPPGVGACQLLPWEQPRIVNAALARDSDQGFEGFSGFGLRVQGMLERALGFSGVGFRDLVLVVRDLNLGLWDCRGFGCRGN